MWPGAYLISICILNLVHIYCWKAWSQKWWTEAIGAVCRAWFWELVIHAHCLWLPLTCGVRAGGGERDRVLLCSSGCPWTCNVPVSATWVLESQTCVTTPNSVVAFVSCFHSPCTDEDTQLQGPTGPPCWWSRHLYPGACDLVELLTVHAAFQTSSCIPSTGCCLNLEWSQYSEFLS